MRDREKLIEFIDEWLGDVPYSEENLVGNLADYLISKGVTIPTQCGECKYWWKQVETCVHPKCCEGVVPVIDAPKIHFCSYGERKEE